MDKWDVYYLGPEGSHTHEAVNQFSMRINMNVPTFKPGVSIAQVIDSVAFAQEENRSSVYGCVPLENSIQGSVSMTWDRLFHVMRTQSNSAMHLNSQPGRVEPSKYFGIHAVLTLPIEHYVLSIGLLQLSLVTHVYSHPQALAQCKLWLEANLPHATVIPQSSTAEAARKVSELQNPTQIAIGSSRAASLYGLETSRYAVQDMSNNCTRFGLLSNERIKFDLSHVSHFVTSICLVGVSNQPGGLLRALEPFQSNGLNLSRIESRPVGHKLGEYLFYLDVEHAFHPEHETVLESWKTVEKILNAHQIDIIRFGTYPELK